MKLDHMKILYVIPRLNNEGPVNQLYSLINEFKKFTNLAIKIVTIYDEIDDSRINDFKKLKIDIESIAIEKKYDIAGMVKQMNKIILKENPDIIHSATLMADILIGMCNTSVKWVSTIHCNIYKDYIWRFGVKGNVVILVHEWAIKKMNLAICCSKSIEKEYCTKFGKKITSVQNGISINENQIKKEKQKIKYDLGLDNSKKTILVIGSIDERKNTRYIIENLSEWINGSNYQLVFLGEGSLFEELKNKNESCNILFKGKVNNVDDYLECGDLYLSASKSEGLPLSVIEAGMKGLPLVLSDIPAHKELQNGKCEEIFFFNINENILSSIIKKVDVSVDKEKNKNYFKKYFSARRMAEEYLDIYNR